ncbi:hypothetical protein PEPS_36750 (plasmid) [Persicobacter psychrovividus]|uniref:DUF5673 domain-containing protein n=1 Tax=Persicobacter psychrovividus TaxID=387638 RepID=A0ABM7VKK3_9BACT|nr:hypothetical protein PEPS_36750 [Persicobacter psychrovividus]
MWYLRVAALVTFIFGISIVITELAFQLLVNRDRLLIGPDNLTFRSIFTIELDWKSIYKISLNGFTSIISIYGDKTIRFNKNRISRIELDELFDEIAIRTGFENIELTDNLKERKTAGNNG